jgi:hypothetical protein
MSDKAKLLILAIVVALIAMASAANAAQTCPYMHMAKHTSCVQEMDRTCSPANWNESSSVVDYGDGTMMVMFVYEPKCLQEPIPCRIASRLVTVMVDCNTDAATCQ